MAGHTQTTCGQIEIALLVWKIAYLKLVKQLRFLQLAVPLAVWPETERLFDLSLWTISID